MEFLQVKNWEDFQHYKDRTPPWIKLYNHLLDDFEFSCLPDASKAHLLSIWLLASRTSNKIPNNARWISNKINATEEVDIKLLMSAGFIELIPNENKELQTSEQDASMMLQTSEQDASMMLQTSEQDACLEREERRGEREGETKKKPKSTKADLVVEIFAYWRKVMDKNNSTTLSAKRQKSIEARLKDGYTVEEIKQAIVNCSNTSHNMGQNDRNTKFNDIELICRNPENLERFRDNPGDMVNGHEANKSNGHDEYSHLSKSMQRFYEEKAKRDAQESSGVILDGDDRHVLGQVDQQERFISIGHMDTSDS